MSEILKGNFAVKRPVRAVGDDEKNGFTEEFERKLLVKLGGSICYVKGKPFIAQPKDSPHGHSKNVPRDSQ